MYVNGGSDYLDGEYRLLWSVDGSFDTAQMATLTTGTVAVGTRAVSVQFTVPESKMGYHYIRFLRVPSGQTYDTSFNVKPAMRLFPLQGKPGTPLMVHGSGFPSGDSGNILFNGAGTSVDYTANAVGSFAAQFTIPSAVSPGEYKIGAVSSRLNEDGLAYVLVVSGYQPPPTTPPETTPPTTTPTIVPPEAPPPPEEPLGPKPFPSSAKGEDLGKFGTKLYTFIWQETSGLPGIKSTIEVSTDPNFSGYPDYLASGVTGTSVSFDLAPGAYYWRVQSVAADGSISEWRTWPYRVEVDFITAWFYAVAGGFLGFILLLVVFTLLTSGRKPKYKEEEEYYYPPDPRYYPPRRRYSQNGGRYPPDDGYYR